MLPQSENRRCQRETRIANLRNGIQQLFAGRSTVGRRASNLESPKIPQVTLGLGSSFSTRLVIPYLSVNTAIQSDNSSYPNDGSSPEHSASTHSPNHTQPITPNALREMEQMMVERPPASHRRSRPFVAVDPEERYLADLVRSRRSRRQRRKRRERQHRYCLPNVTNRKIRSKIISCLISGIFLMVVLSIYLALALSDRDESQEFHVILILVILGTTIFFCHALITLCMLAVRSPSAAESRSSMSAVLGPRGYANPSHPIPVTLARDEEAAGIESEATKVPPPAYGLWRESVRVDPNRLFWQRNEAELSNPRPLTPYSETAGTNRPPSYLSEDGVAYVIEAAPRSIAPTTDVPLSTHPSERGLTPWIAG